MPAGDDQGINRLSAYRFERLGDESQSRGCRHRPTATGDNGETIGSRRAMKGVELASCREDLQRACDVEQLYTIEGDNDDVTRAWRGHRLLVLADFASTLLFLPRLVSGKMAAVPREEVMPFRIGFVLFPRLTQLDLTGPYEVLSRMPDAEIDLVASTCDPVQSDRGLAIVPTTSRSAMLRFLASCAAQPSKRAMSPPCALARWCSAPRVFSRAAVRPVIGWRGISCSGSAPILCRTGLSWTANSLQEAA